MARRERSAGFIIFHDQAGPAVAPNCLNPEFLLLDYGRHWDFAKGHVEAGEDDLQAALRELHEETGISNARVLPHFQQEISYYFRHRKHGLVQKSVVFFLGQTTTRRVILSHEHKGYIFLPYQAALKRLTFPSARQVLRAAWETLNATQAATESDRMS